MRPYLIVSLVVLVAAVAAWLLLRAPEPTGTSVDVAPTRPAGRELDGTGPAASLPGPPLAAPEPTGTPPPDAGRFTPAYAGVRGEAVDEQDRPLAGARVWLETLDPFVLRGGRTTPGERLTPVASTETDGTFALPFADVRWVRVVAALEGYATVGAPVPGPGSFVKLRLPRGGAADVRVSTAKDRAIADAEVVVRARDALLVARTDERGRARVDGLAPGRIEVRVRAEGYGESATGPLRLVVGETLVVPVVLSTAVALRGRIVDARDGAGIGEAEVHLRLSGRTVEVGRTGPDGSFGPVAVATAGEPLYVAARAEGHAPALWLVHPQAIAGGHEVEVPLEPADPWQGRVVDERGGAVAGARVTTTPDGIHGRPAPVATTDEHGRFTLPPPPPPVPGRRVVLVAEAAAGRAAHALRPGDLPPEDLELVLRRGVVVTGRVLDAGDVQAATGLTVRLDPVWRAIADRMRPGPETARLHGMSERGRLSLTTTTDDAGWWRIAGVPDGRYLVRLLAPQNTVFGPAPFDVRGADANAGTIRLGSGHPLTGRTLDETGRALTGAEVTVSATAPPRRAWRATADADGYWRLDDLPAGTYDLRATLPGQRWTSVPGVAVPREDPVDLVLPAGGRLTGRLLLEQGTYRGAFTLTATPPGRTGRSRGLRRTMTTADGTFVLEGLAEREWRIRVETPDGLVGEAARPVQVRPGASTDVQIDLRASSGLRGVLRTADGAAVVRGELRLRHAVTGRKRDATVGSAGRYRLMGLAPGTWTLSARGRGGAPATSSVTLAAGSEQEHDLVLPPGGALAVRVMGADGRPRSGALVAARAPLPSADLPAYRAPPRTGPDGRVRLDDLPPGPVIVNVRAPTGEGGQAEATVEAGRATEIVVTVRPGGR